MEKNLQQLLEKIEFDLKKYSFFDTGKLLKIVGNKDKTSYNFNLELEKNLPFDIYLELDKLIKKSFNTIKNIKIIIFVRNDDYEFIPYYYRHFIDLLSNISPLLGMFKRVPISMQDNILNVKLNNKAEEEIQVGDGIGPFVSLSPPNRIFLENMLHSGSQEYNQLMQRYTSC